MRVFEQDHKINFVDTNDVYVGFDAFQSCCESFGYHYADSADKKAEEVGPPSNLEDLIFDTEFFAEHEGDYEQAAVFRLKHPALRDGNDAVRRAAERRLQAEGQSLELFLVLYNHHNGYYGHGFDMTHNGTVIHSGGI